MSTINIPGGGPRANTIAAVDIAGDRFYRYGTTENEVILTSEGEEADGFCLVAVTADELLNTIGHCQSRKDTGTYSGVIIDETFTAGSEFMSGASGTIIAHTGTNRALGRFLTTGVSGDAAKILVYAN